MAIAPNPPDDEVNLGRDPLAPDSFKIEIINSSPTDKTNPAPYYLQSPISPYSKNVHKMVLIDAIECLNEAIDKGSEHLLKTILRLDEELPALLQKTWEQENLYCRAVAKNHPRLLALLDEYNPTSANDKERALSEAFALACNMDNKIAKGVIAQMLRGYISSSTVAKNSDSPVVSATKNFQFHRIELLKILGSRFDNKDKMAKRPIDIIADISQEALPPEKVRDYLETTARILVFGPLAHPEEESNSINNMLPVLEMAVGHDIRGDTKKQEKDSAIFAKWAAEISQKTGISTFPPIDPQDKAVIALAMAMRIHHASEEIRPQMLETVAKTFQDIRKGLIIMDLDAKSIANNGIRRR